MRIDTTDLAFLVWIAVVILLGQFAGFSRKRIIAAVAILLCVWIWPSARDRRALASINGYQYVYSVVVDKTKCGSSVTSNYAVAFSLNNPQLRTAANGGAIQNANGYDLIFASDQLGASLVPWEIEYYDGTNGVITGHFKGTCSNAANQTYYMLISNAAISTAQNTGAAAPVNVWNSGLAVYHLPNGTSLTANDSLGNYNGTLSGTPAPSPVAGELDGGASFDGANSWINVSGTNALTWNSNSVSAWVYPTICRTQAIVDSYNNAGISFRLNNDGGTTCKPDYEYYKDNSNFKTREATTNLSLNTWHYVVGTLDGTTINLYVDGALVAMNAQGNTGSLSSSYAPLATGIGFRPIGGINKWQGSMDEVREYNRVLSADEILATYNNFTTPGNIGTAGFLTYTLLGSPTHTSGGTGGVSSIRNVLQGQLAGFITAPTVTQTQNMIDNYASNSGDTNLYTGWSPSGLIVGQCNDGSCTNGGTQPHLAITSLSYNPSTPGSTTLTMINTMSSYGLNTQATTLTGETGTYYWSSYSPFYVGANLYLNVFRRGTGTGNTADLPYASDIIMSPDDGQHWCNSHTYAVGGNGGAHTCDAGNWSATGDAPTAVANMLWPAGADGTGVQKFAQWTLIQTCQANTINCPAIPGVDTNYIYFLASYVSGGALQGIGIHRILKTADPQLAASWGHYDGSTWNADYTLTSKIFGYGSNSATSSVQFIHGAMWNAELKMYVGFGEDDNSSSTNFLFTSQDQLHWSQQGTVTQSGGLYAVWYCPILGLRRVSGGHVIYPVVFDNNHNAQPTFYTMSIQDLDFGASQVRTTVARAAQGRR